MTGRAMFLVLLGLFAGLLGAEEALPELTARILKTANAPTPALTRFTLKDRLIVGAKTEGKKPSERTQEISVPDAWKEGARDRIAAKDKAAEIGMRFMWGWTLAPLSDPRFTVRRAPEEEGRIVLIATGPIDPELTLVFRADDLALVELRWNSQLVRFSEWKTFAGIRLPARGEGLNAQGRAWYHFEVVDVIPAPVPAP
jgi:hypothetical protein